MRSKALPFIGSIALFVLPGCGGAGPSQTVQPVLTVNFPERNRSVIKVNEMVESLTIILFRPNTNEILYGPFRARRLGSPSAAHSQAFQFPPVAAGTYRMAYSGWSEPNETGVIAGSGEGNVRITPEATIVRTNGTPFVVDLLMSPSIRDVQLAPGIANLRVGEFSSGFFIGKHEEEDRYREIPNAWLRFTWIEGREKLEAIVNEPSFLSYKAVAPGIVRFKVSFQDYTSPELVLDIKP